MKPNRSALALAFALALAALAPPARAAGYDAPTGLTLQAQGGGHYLLLWDPIYRDDLMGYSVWLRRGGEREFTRLSIPVRAGGEVRKQPMTSDAKVVLALGRDRADLEFTVVSEYEGGRSERAPTAYSARAARPAAAALEGGPESPSSTARSQEPAPSAPALSEEPTPRPGEEAPWQKRLERNQRPLLAERGKLETRLGLGFDLIRSMGSGNDPFSITGLIGTGIDPKKVVSWKHSAVRTRFIVPVGLSLGLFPGVEAWGEASYHAEDYYLETYSIDGTDYSYIRYVHVNSDGSLTYLSNPTSAGLGDARAGLRLQPVPSQPLVIGAEATFPTGSSRMQAFLDWMNGNGYAAGTGEGVLRLAVTVEAGWRGRREGLSFHGRYSPGTTEQLTEGSVHHVVNRGDLVEVGGDYTLPWNLYTHGGAVVAGLTGRSISADRWTANGQDVAPQLDKITRLDFTALNGLKFERDDQLEFSVEALQDLPGGMTTGGRFSYTTEVFGEKYSVAGVFYY